MEKELILQISAREGSNADTADGSVGRPTKSLITEVVTGSNQQYGWVPDLIRDLGVALWISVIVTFLVEKYASDRLREDIAYNVLSAAYTKVVPEKIYTQVADNVFRSEVYRKDWEVHINEEHFNSTDGIAIITARYSYELENLKEQEISHEIAAGIDLDVATSDSDIPKFTLLEFPLVPEEDVARFLANQSTPETRERLASNNDVVAFRKLTFNKGRSSDDRCGTGPGAPSTERPGEVRSQKSNSRTWRFRVERTRTNGRHQDHRAC